MQHGAVNREAVRLGGEHADHLIFAVRRPVLRAEHIHPVVDGVAVVRRDIQIPVAVDLVDLGRPKLLGIRLARRGRKHALALAGEVMDIVRAADFDIGVIHAVHIVIVALPLGDKGVCTRLKDRVVESFGHSCLRICAFFFYCSTFAR